MAGAVAVIAGQKAVESASSESGLINQAFKLTILIGLALAIFATVFLIYNLTDILDGLFDSLSGLGRTLTTPLSVPGAIFTGIISALPFGRGLSTFLLRS